jgi:hypothetical protein
MAFCQSLGSGGTVRGNRLAGGRALRASMSDGIGEEWVLGHQYLCRGQARRRGIELGAPTGRCTRGGLAGTRDEQMRNVPTTRVPERCGGRPKAMKLSYSEGSVFLVPLKGGGHARGVVARVSPQGKALLGYFFGPRLATPADVSVEDLDPGRAVLRVIVGDLGLLNGEWTVCGQVPFWDRSKWPMPAFVRRDPLGRKKPRLVRYADEDPMRIEAEHVINDDPGLPPDAAYGYGALENELAALLG